MAIKVMEYGPLPPTERSEARLRRRPPRDGCGRPRGGAQRHRAQKEDGMTANWPETGAIPVFRGDRDNPELVGYTTFRINAGFTRRFMMTVPGASKGPGDTFMVGEAEIRERQTSDGSYLAW